jgi:hypothetical protein
MFLFTYPHIRKENDGIPLTGLTPSCFSHLSTYQEGKGWDTIDRFNPLMLLFTYPHISKDKDMIPLTGLTPSCFCLPIHISGRRRIGYH